MRLVSVDNLSSGQVLGKRVLGSNGRVLLQSGVALTPGYIRKLKELHLTYVYVQDAETYDIEIVETVHEEVQQEVLTKIYNVYAKMSDPIESERLVESGSIGREFSNLFKLIFELLLEDRALILNLTAIYSSDAYLYTQCMNVGITASVLGIAHGLTEERSRQFGLGAMLHDIGKLKIDRKILDKPGQRKNAKKLRSTVTLGTKSCCGSRIFQPSPPTVLWNTTRSTTEPVTHDG